MAPHYSQEVCQYLNENDPGRWIRRGCEAPAARSPDYNPLDCFCAGI